MRMPSLDEARKISRNGLFFICATCPKWWEGKALGKDACSATNCGSPMRRKDFPEYSGEIRNLSSICFVCGSEDVLAYAKIEGSQRNLGLCKNHLELIDELVERDCSNNGKVTKKILIFPSPERAMGQFKGAKHVI